MLICDKRRPASREQPDTSPPEGGDCPPFAHPSVGCALRLRRPARRLGRLHGGGACRPPAPLGCAPWRAHAHRAPAACRPVGRGKRSAQGRRPGGFPGFGGNFKKAPQGREAGRGLGGRAPPGREAVGNPAQAVGGQGAAAGCARRPRTGRGCPRTTGPQGAAVEAVLAAPHSAYYVQSEKQRAGKPRKA